MYEERFYRNRLSSKFGIEVSYKESDLYVSTDKQIDTRLVQGILKRYYEEIENYIKINPRFLTSLSPLSDDESATSIIKDMLERSRLTGVGPFASVAGAIALYVGKELLDYANEVIVENGGDLFIKINEDKRIGVYLGERFKLENIAIKVKKKDYPFGIASSSAFIGHSLNFGRADLVTVIAKDAILADGFATAFSNAIKKEQDLEEVLEKAKQNPLIDGLLIAFEGKILFWGEVEING
jgi:ApbE superfamily uncharacterized protein (UPF0280 family)